MKKLFSSLLALAMILSIGAGATAVTVDKNNGNQSIDVNAKFVKNSDEAVYSVDVVWDSMEFTYNESNLKKWNSQKHEFEVDSQKAWVGDKNSITITNHSNVEIGASFDFAALPKFSGIEGNFSKSALKLPSAVNKAVGSEELTGKVEFCPKGALDKDVTEMTKIGNITVKIS